MLVSHRKKFIYTKTLRTADTNVEAYFEKYCLPEGAPYQFTMNREPYTGESGIVGARGGQSYTREWWGHMPAAGIREKTGQALWDDYFKFCVIRNPFTKLISYFHFLDASPGLARMAGEEIWNGKTTTERFRNWLKSGLEALDRPLYVIDGQLCMDYLIRYEQLENGMRHVCERLAIPWEPENMPGLKTILKEQTPPLQEYFDQEAVAIVTDVYRFELETFDYPPPL